MNNEDCFISNVIYNCFTKHKCLKYLLGVSVLREHKGKKESVMCSSDRNLLSFNGAFS